LTRYLPFLFIILLSLFPVFSQVSDEDQATFALKKRQFSASEFKQQEFGRFVVSIAKSFEGIPYVAHTLEGNATEQITVNLRGFDCTTFIESVLALARTIRGNGSYSNFLSEIEKIRYRQGKLTGYCSRLHYFSEWIVDNERKGIIKDITPSLGGKKISFNVNFMSEHPRLYAQLSGRQDRIDSIRVMEKTISAKEFAYIPRENVYGVENSLHEGDIVAFTTSVKGLDIGHVGFITKGKNGRCFLLHAPQEGSHVQVAVEPLSEYIAHVKKHSGIILRPVSSL
jgi:hypothetical protein